MRLQAKTLLFLAAAVLGGCSVAADDEVGESENASTNAQLEGMWMRLPVPGLRLGQPLNSVTGSFPASEAEDGRPEPCVVAMNPVPSGVSNTVTYTAINSQKELLKELNLDLGINVGANVAAGAAQASAEGSLNLVRSFKASATSGAFLFRARIMFEIGQGGGRWPRLAPTAPTGTVEEFVRKCGDRYVAGLRFGAEYNALIQYETATVEQKNQISAGLTGRVTGQGDVESRLAQLEARVRAQTSNAESESSVKLSILVHSVGLGTQTMPTYLCTTDRYDPVACAARAAMDLSRVLIEMGSIQQQLDRIQNELRGQPPGTSFDQFLAENPQLVFPPIQEVAAANYADKATNVPSHIAGELEEFGPFRQKLNSAKRTFDDLATTELRLAQAKAEVDAFLSSPRKNTFGLYASPTAPALTPAQYQSMPTNTAGLEAIAAPYAAKLDPLDAATPRGLLRNAVLQCKKAIEQVSSPCSGETRVADGTVASARAAAVRLLDEYNANGRIVPIAADDLGMQYRSTSEDLCRARGKRLPNSDEAHRMEPFLGGRETWLSTGKGNPNGCIVGFEWSAEGHSHDCRIYPYSKALAVCVPNDGPFNGAPLL